ncbi:DUF6252 family protein [Lacinutrix sp. Bg11-31]|uniref:DUF6252 family protein n=1 Tax=Lacinutrix sp. Bg11-31 TaxID=2057808 RepID=UPI000C31A1FD|nr:DUF6252 family protein [Lacinutrix sp. Bg11-31]AUC81646.1 hypothetical protein CW733_05675 [Lacinutrix sp. Bg11-31]
MKKFKLASVFILSILFSTFYSCQNEPLDSAFVGVDGSVGSGAGNGGTNNQTGMFKVDFDGQTYIADVVAATVLDDAINITGLRGSNGEAVIVTITENNGVGTYQLGVTNGVQANAVAYSEANNTGFGTWIAATTDGTVSQGEVIITEIDAVNEKISGTFSFTGNNLSLTPAETKEFTNGVFSNVSYAADLSTPNGNEFFAKIDGSEFVEDTVFGIQTSLAGFTTIGITATKNNLESIGFSLPADITTGTYNFSFGSLDDATAQYNVGMNENTIGDGTITISSHNTTDKRIIATFEFVASPFIGTGNSYNITEGSFDITYQ